MSRAGTEFSDVDATDYVEVIRMSKGPKTKRALLSTVAEYLDTRTQVLTGDGAISIKSGTCFLNKNSKIAATLAAPTATTDDGKVLRIVDVGGGAHEVTISAGVNGAGSGADVGTFGGAKGDSVVLVAYQGNWYECGANHNVTWG